MKTTFFSFSLRLLLAALLISMTMSLSAQTFSTVPNNVLSLNTVAPGDVHLADLDEDGDLDIVYSYPNGIFSWIENLDGLGNYGTPQPFANVGYFMRDIHSGDIDLDGDTDIIAVNSYGVEGLSWFENLGCDEPFSNAQVISSGQFNIQTNCYPADLDGDGDLDVLTHTNNDHLVWFNNTNGLGNFGSPLIIDNVPSGISGHVYAADIDGDGDMDVVAASSLNNQINWYENLNGFGNFGSPQSVASSVFGLGNGRLYAVDMDGDGDMDILTGTLTDRIAWYENTDGFGTFGPEQIIFTFTSNDLHDVYPEDVDGDGDMDIVSVQNYSITLFENIDCAGSFGPPEIIVPYAQGANTAGSNLSLGDIDGDGDMDLLVQDTNQIRIEWYENITSNSVFYMPEEVYICDGVFEELCGPFSSVCNSYAYSWYYNNPVTQTSDLVTNGNPFEQCYTPNQYGDYTLVVEDGNGGYIRYNTSIIELLPEPVIALNDEICIGEMIMLLNDVYDHCSYEFTWFHNGDLVQEGGSVLTTSFTSGTVTLEVSNSSCPDPVSTTVTIVECCPIDLELAMNCETGELFVENLPNNITIQNTYWYLNNDLIQSGTETSLLATEFGTYSFGIIFNLSNGEECHHFIHFEYYNDYCCDQIGLNAVASILNSNHTYPIEETPYGPMDVPIVVCELELDGSLSTCEDSYHIMIEPYNPVDWTSAGAVIYDEWYSGQAPSSIPIPSGVLPTPSNGQFYLLTFAVGPTYTPTYLAFWYTCPEAKTGRRLVLDSISKQEISLFPNPANETITLRSNHDLVSYQIFDVNGKGLVKDNLQTLQTEIDLSLLSSGVYFFKIQDHEGTFHFQKVIKE